MAATLPGVCATQFINLDFESAQVGNLAAGQGEFVQVSNAFPGWKFYVGNEERPNAYHNGSSLGANSVSILGPNFGAPNQILSGNYTALLQGAYNYNLDRASASLAQVGEVPDWANSIQFKLSAWPGDFRISLAGNNLPLFVVETNAAYKVMGADVSWYKGAACELRFTSFYQGVQYVNYDLLDDIVFSSDAVPEPGTLALWCVGGLIGYTLGRKRRVP
ncbi:MAG: PEP-CTERM sorting domain-containing protein [Verrucomicrobiota bacterium]